MKSTLIKDTTKSERIELVKHFAVRIRKVDQDAVVQQIRGTTLVPLPFVPGAR